jgi:ribosomal protein S18 acetylase RimI-like enzyme
MLPYIIREARRHEGPAVTALWKEMMDLHGTLDSRFRFESGASREFERHFAATIRSRDARILVADSGNLVVGYILGEIHDRKALYPEGKYGFISDICVTGASRNQGIGRGLVDGLMLWFKNRGITAVELFAADRNPESMAFWRSMGFVDFLRLMRTELPSSK